jgi:hypothetical protein
MRSSTISNLAIAASSLLVKEVFAGPVGKRDQYVVTDVVIVTQEMTVYDYGTSFSTGAPVDVATFTSQGVPVLIPATTSSTSTSSPIPTSTQPPAVFIQQSTKSSTSTTTSTTPAPVVVKPTTPPAPVVVPTTLVPVVSSPAPVTTPTGSTTSSSSKRGLAYNDASLLTGFSGSNKISWAYNWGSSTASVPSAFEYVPLLWGTASSFTNNWISAATKAIASGSTHLMSFNEPDLNTQANLSPEAAAAAYKTYLSTPFAGKAQLGSPAVTNGAGAMGLTWLKNFLASCTDCQIDFVCIHWYNGGDAAAFMDYVDTAYAAGGNRPLWITEFQGEGDATAQNTFLQTVIPQLDASPKVARYAYFMASDGVLLSSGSKLSTLGNTFASAP